MRKQLLNIFLPLVLVTAAAAQSAGTAAAPKRAALLQVKVVPGEDGINLEITTRGQITPKLSTLDSPARVVLDLPGTVAASSRNILVDSDGVKRVRVGMDGQNPPDTRLVVAVAQTCRYDLAPQNGDKLILKLHTGTASAKSGNGRVIPAVSAPSPATVREDPPAATEKAATSKVTAPNAASLSEPAPASSSSTSATNFVFVEPSYKPKDKDKAADATAAEKQPAVTAPPARALTAASKFAEKPDTDLLPTPSASMQPQGANSSGSQPAQNLAAEQKAQMARPAVVTGPKYTGEPISVNLKDVDLKDFFRLIHEISGLNVVLDPNVKGTLTIVLDDVPWDQALDIVLKNNDLARQLDGNVLRIATVDTLRKEAEGRRAQQEAEALAVDKVTVTRFLSYARSKDIAATVKQFLSQRGDVIADDIPGVIPAVDRLITQLDRKTQEVEIEARVVAATRSFARDIGTQLGFGWGNGVTSVGGAGSVGTSPLGTFGLNPLYPVVGTSVPSPTTISNIPLFSNQPVTSPSSGFSFLNASSHFQIDAILTMAESRGLLKVLSRPRVVTQNNIQAVVRQGVRVPIVTQAQLGGPPTVTYVDAFLRLTVVPQITSENTIFLNVDVENTTPDFGHEVQGNPTLITQQATTQVLVTDGGTVVIGGVIQTQDSVNITQVPLLGDIPYLGNLFKHRSVQTSNQELIFFITPRIIQT